MAVTSRMNRFVVSMTSWKMTNDEGGVRVK
jgi:hypothetical protein